MEKTEKIDDDYGETELQAECPVCGGNIISLREKREDNYSYEVEECIECGATYERS